MATQRRNPLTGEWIIVSPHRISRPWGGEKSSSTGQGFTKVSSYLSPGAARSNGSVNPLYTSTFVFPNDFSALVQATPGEEPGTEPGEEPGTEPEDELFQSEPAGGECHVMCFSPHSHLSLPLMRHEDILSVIREWIRLSDQLKYNLYVQIFENKGAMVGCSNSHPHCQIWSSSFLPYLISLEDSHQREYFSKHNSPLLVKYLEKEMRCKKRVVEESEYWVALVPYWAKWPFELLLLPTRHVTKLRDLTEEEVLDLSSTMKRYLTRYDNLFECSFPYSMGWHEAPNTASDCSHWQLHAHYYPPLLRTATVKKHIAGYEMLAQCQRDLTAEDAAQRLKDCDALVHFTQRNID
ncbi:galactose-1-phosphate uridylyltransferase-like isoform X2 [Bolinopsis microptera]|uniref:galactose-1-phosphate uridylyltransferase-like isoform X2 n=1 Tax=Bolinopsis microptera TaxID=2820187 RepID=UPI0030792791